MSELRSPAQPGEVAVCVPALQVSPHIMGQLLYVGMPTSSFLELTGMNCVQVSGSA